MSTTPPELRELHERLHAATPVTYPGLDLEAVVGQGRRTVRRRRLGAVVVTAVTAAAVALGASLAVSGRTPADPVPAGQTSDGAGRAAGTTGTVSLTISVMANAVDPGDHTYVVSLAPGPGDDLLATFSEQRASGLAGLGGSSVPRTGGLATWGHGDGSPVVVGLIPSASAQHAVIATTDADYGGFASDVAPIAGTDWSAFVLYFDKPVASSDPITDLLWFDASFRPVDRDGRRGVATASAGRHFWLAPDGRTFGVGTTSGTASTTTLGGIPSLVQGVSAGPTTEDWDVVALLPPGTVSGTLHLVGGRDVPVTVVGPLGSSHALGSVTVTNTKNVAPRIASLTWVDASGVSHEQQAG